MKRVRNILPVLVILVGLLILLYPTISNFLIEQNSSRAVASYDAATVDLAQQEREQMLADARAYNERLANPSGTEVTVSEGCEPAQNVEVLSNQELLDLNGNGMMGYIIIPKMNVELPIYHTVEEKVLQVGVGHLENTSLPVGGPSTHASLSGHRGLPSAKLFTDLDQPHETESLAIQEGEDLVTLITCTPYAINSHRLLVHAHRIPYVPEMDEVIEQVGGFINIPLPYLRAN